jgi:ornithine carbamoyltransferase
MPSFIQPLQGPRLDRLSPADADILLANARQLQGIAEASQTANLLRGKKLGLLCESEEDVDALRFRRAAAELGAHVAHIRPSLSEPSAPRVLQRTARVLGRLYDAIECQGLATELVRFLGDEAGVPVYDAIASATHPTAALAPLLGDERPAEENRSLILQAVLVSTLL